MKQRFNIRPVLPALGIAVLLAAVTASCTGDPTKGGIFWSPSQAQARQDALRADLANKTAELNTATNTTAQKQQQLQSLRAQLARARQKAAAPQNNTAAEDSAEIEKLQAEVRALEKEIETISNAF